MSNLIVGFSSLILLGYSLMLIGIHIFIPHPSVTKKVMRLSYQSLSLLTLAQGCIVGTYFIPHISGACLCNGLWAASLVFYVVALYTLKFIYVERISILNQHPMLGMFDNEYIHFFFCSFSRFKYSKTKKQTKIHIQHRLKLQNGLILFDGHYEYHVLFLW